ncbi:RNA polymerase [Viridothelium virens]|uniref:DNA-directed RNA polymerases I, II, and III subunit RPABC3 n=1 Tax=Viridothelium virens TaxID=1048519 RepID=A0A6A6HNX6_VIRVR|nr:RNA polymerase [Viridothelium virens]
MADAQLFEDQFSITSSDPQKYDRVSRITGNSPDHSVKISLDINTDLYPIQVGETVTLLLASTLNLDGTKDDEKGWREPKPGEAGLADMYDYVCHGKIYRFDEGQNDDISVFVSFGGLLLKIDGPYKKLTGLRIDSVYLLMKR